MQALRPMGNCRYPLTQRIGSIGKYRISHMVRKGGIDEVSRLLRMKSSAGSDANLHTVHLHSLLTREAFEDVNITDLA